ncbi:MAG: PAS domain S-box protein [Gemmatimonadota bacterium]
MESPIRPPDEAERLRALQRYAVLDTLPEQALDDITTLASQICNTPTSLISFVDRDRQWFKSRVGMTLTETPRDVSFCGHAILSPELFIVRDTTADPRFADNPLVTGDPHIRFYAGAPLITPEGQAVGSLCVTDRVPRELTPAQQEALQALSRQVIAQLELRLRAHELEESEGRLLHVFQSCPVAISIHRWGDRQFVDVNSAFVRMLGWHREELLGRTTTEVGIIDEAGSAVLRAQLAATGMVRDTMLEVHSRDGTTRTVLVGIELVELRREQHALTTFVDMTDRRTAEVAMRESEARYRALFEYAPDGILIADAQSTYLDANESICRMLGYTREELIGKNATDIVTPVETRHIESALDAIASTTTYHREWQFRRSDGSTFPAEVMATLMPDGRILAMIRDLTDRKQLEQQFLRAQRLESIGTLAGGIAHDLNNVLAPILLSIELLRDEVASADAAALLDTLQGSAERGSNLVKQVLSFARGVEGQRIPVNPTHLMRDLLTVMRDTFPKTIDLRFHPPRDLWTVIGDPTQLHQVFLNLCVNARDAMPGGGALTVTMDNVTLDETYAGMNLDALPGDYVVIRVEDTGVGIPPEIRDRILEPFFTTKEVGKGTGLGLSTALAIVKSHGGFIHLYSEVNKGTKFKVYLPADPSGASVERAVAERPSLPRGSGELILVVDDEEAIRRIARRSLEQFGYRVVLASHGAEAVAIYAQQMGQIAAVITDMAMPIMDGPALIMALTSMNPEVKIIGSSGLPSNDGVARALGAGVAYFVPKPYTAEILLRVLQRVLVGERDSS